jgi:L-aminopeptidase/D-esterase-like protein
VNAGHALPPGFAIGHWTDPEAATGCTVVIPPPGTVGAADIRGGGTGTREIEVMAQLATAQEVTGLLLTGGSAFGLAAADGVVRWLEQHGLGYETPAARVPLVPAAVVYDLMRGRADVRPGPEDGYAACEAAVEGPPERGKVGAGTGAAVGKLHGHDRAAESGVGYAAARLGSGEAVGALAVVNAMGDVLGEDGEVIAGPRGEGGEPHRTAEALAAMESLPDWRSKEGQNTTLACVMTDAALDKPACGVVARMASAGIARAVDPAFTPVDGDVSFCLASGARELRPYAALGIGTLAATLVAAAIRDSVRQA